jgi:hypothetical protein
LFSKYNISNKKKLIICPDGIFNTLAFEAILISSKNIHSQDYKKLDYMINRLEIEYVLAPRYFKKDGTLIPLKIKAFAPINKNALLPFSEKLIDYLEAKQGAKTFKGRDAKLEYFNHVETPILHFSGHGSIDEKISSFSTLAFSDSVLRIETVYKHKSPKMVVLNACNSSNGKTLTGDGIDGFVRAYHSAGAELTISNLWEVDDKSSNELFQRFYEVLGNEKSVSKAMQQTKIDKIKGAISSEAAAPYYWAGHRVVGKVNVEKVAKSDQLIFCGIIFILLLFYLNRLQKKSN